MPVTIDPKTGKTTHHSYDPTSKTHEKALAAGHTAGANPHAKTRKNAKAKRSY